MPLVWIEAAENNFSEEHRALLENIAQWSDESIISVLSDAIEVVNSLKKDTDQLTVMKTVGLALSNCEISLRDLMILVFMVVALKHKMKEDAFGTETIGIT